MDRRLSTLVSPNPDINENRKIGIELIEEYNKTPHVATKEDIHWFDQDLDMIIDSDVAWDYVTPRIKELSEMYPFYITEWFEEFYRYMPELLPTGRDGTGQIDWNIFFSLAYPLPKLPYLSFRSMIQKLDVAQNRIVRAQIKEEIWNDKELRRKIMNWENIPSIYTNYIAYQTIRKAIVERHEKQERALQREKERDMSKPYDDRMRLLRPLFFQFMEAQRKGKEVILQ